MSYTSTEIRILLSAIWADYFKKTKDSIPKTASEYCYKLKIYFFSVKWYEIYDLIEFVASVDDKERASLFVMVCNNTLEKELSAYRFINGQITQISATQEVDSIEEALDIEDKFKPVKIHLERSLALFSSRTSPDYRNSIKESIRAVESYCSISTGDSKAMLGQALKQIEKQTIFIRLWQNLSVTFMDIQVVLMEYVMFCLKRKI